MSKPSIDFGYPTPAHGRIPALTNVEEEAEFWDTHAVTDFLDESHPVEIVVGPELQAGYLLQLDRAEREGLARRAGIQGTDAASLARA